MFLPPHFLHSPIAIALSGGADSWALALMAQEQGIEFTALTVDHKLRPESTAEAEAVAAECARRGIKHHILTWTHDGVATRVQERARDARYALLIDYCKANNIPALLTAHHADDQAETILLRLARASDVAGLGGLRESTMRDGITIIRPLLGMTKQQLVDYVAARGVPFITDPSNANPHYARARLRAAHDVLAAEGLTTETMLKLGHKMQLADEALEWSAQHFILQHAQQPNPLVWRLPLAELRAAPVALRIRALQTVWRRVRGNDPYMADYDALRGVADDLGTKRTCGGAVFEPMDDGFTRLYREASTITDQCDVAAGSMAIWDGRFRITNTGAAPVTVTALGNVSTAQLEKTAPWAVSIGPAAARATLPAVDGRPIPFDKPDTSGVYTVLL